MAKVYKAKIEIRPGVYQEVKVEADSTLNAKDLIKIQYGNPKILIGPLEVRR